MALESDLETIKKTADEAMRRGDFKTAEALYSEVLDSSARGGRCLGCDVRAAVLCNRALARLKLEAWRGAEQDVSEALAAQQGSSFWRYARFENVPPSWNLLRWRLRATWKRSRRRRTRRCAVGTSRRPRLCILKCSTAVLAVAGAWAVTFVRQSSATAHWQD
mmetsp:Transcript_52413/g.170128  ORF Transcript_52413/g.170128 Transcript_52413/m.170128 type:complete len:163 (-) Transcript_52413:63-551(-)